MWLGLGMAAIVIVALALAFLRFRKAADATASAPAPAPAAAAPAAASTGPPGEQPPEFVNDRLRREIATEGLTVDRARQLFALEVASLPGVASPDGPVRPTISGTEAFMLLMEVRDRLTPEQRKRLDDLQDFDHSTWPADLPPAPTFPTIAPFTLSASPTPAPTSAPTSPAVKPAVFHPGDRPRLMFARLSDADEDKQNAYRVYFEQLYAWANDAVSTLTGQPKIPKFKLVFRNIEDEYKTAWVLTTTWKNGERIRAKDGNTEVDACGSEIDVRKFQAWPFDVHLSVVVHEVVHCYQQEASPSAHHVATVWGWLQEGENTWAQMVIVPSAVFTALQTHWTTYLSTPRGHLFARRYDAAGFFGHVADVAGVATVGTRLIPAFLLAGDGTNDPAYHTIVSGFEDIVLDTWAPSYFRTHESQFLWTAKGPGNGNFPSDKAKPETLTVGAGDTIPLTTTEPWELSLISLDTSADIVMIASGQGHAALIDHSEGVNKILTPGEPIYLCVRGDCKCPPDTEGSVPPTLRAQAKIDIGLTGGRTGALGWAHGESLTDHCRPKPDGPPMAKLAPNGGGGGSGPGGEPERGKVSSDPHIATLDGRWYDLQAVGEFVLSQSTEDKFAVQVRFGRIGALRTVSVATAMAMTVGADRVTVTTDAVSGAASSQPIVVKINGAPLTKDVALLAGGSVRAVFNEAGTGYVIELADRTRVGISPFVRQGLNVWVDPSPARKGKLTGLLGNNDGDAVNDPVVRGSSLLLGESPVYEHLYGTFANSWRVKQEESLFDYAAGETTATFTDLAFPDRNAPAIDATAMTAAESSCKAGGITSVTLLRNCAFDLAATGNQQYVRAYRPQQRRTDIAIVLAGLRGSGIVTKTTAAGRTKSVVLEGRVTDGASDAFASFQGFKGDVIYFDPDNCQKPRFMTILGPDSKTVGGSAPPCGFRLQLPMDGSYRLSLNPFHDFTGPYRMSILAVRPDRITTIKPGDALAGTLNTRAEQDVFLVEMKSPGAITLGGNGCDANFDVSVYFGDDELVGAGPACRIGKVTLPKAGTYRIVTNPFNNTTGPYRVPTM